MADISNVNAAVIKDLYERLEGLGCKTPPHPVQHLTVPWILISSPAARIMTRILY